MSAERWDSVVIGAGLAGLSAAARLAAAGHRTLVVEARDRCGGRTCTVPSADGIPIDIGGQWIGPGQERVLALVDRLGLETVSQFDTGHNILDINGHSRSFSGTIPGLPPWNLVDLQVAMWRLEAMSRRLDVNAPWQSAQAGRWDAMTVGHWLGRYVRTDAARRVLRVAIHAVYAAEPETISLLQFLFYIRSAGGLMKLLDARGGAQDRRIVGGAQQLSERLADEVHAAGGRVRLGMPVRQLHWSSRRVGVICDGLEVTSDHVIVAMAPAAAAEIDFDPPLPPQRRQIMERMPMGSAIKCIALYNEPFWRAAGYSGEMVTDSGPLRMCFDVTPPVAGNGPGGLVGFILGAEAIAMSGEAVEQRREAVISQLSRHFGSGALKPIEYIEHDWCADTWAKGCYVGHPAPGVLSRWGRYIRQATGRIHWAGTETAVRWNGYMDGAIESGERAAAELLAG